MFCDCSFSVALLDLVKQRRFSDGGGLLNIRFRAT